MALLNGDSSDFPLSFRGITRLSKKHSVTLKPGAVMGDFHDCGCGCALTTLAVANELECTYDVREGELADDPNFSLKARAVEYGFEGWGDRGEYRKDDVALWDRYYRIGLRLREYAGY